MLRRKVKFLALVCHSLGELDVLFPFFARLKAEHKVGATIIIAVKSIYEKAKAKVTFRDFPLDLPALNAAKLLQCIEKKKKL